MKSVSAVVQRESGVRESDLREAYARGRERWPEFSIPYVSFRARCSLSLADEPEPRWLQHSADLYLCCACLDRQRGAIEALEAQVFPHVRNALQRVHESPEFIEETLQTLRDRLFVGPPPKLASYAGRGPLVAWVCVSAARLALDALRARKVARRAQHAAFEQDQTREFDDPLVRIQQSRYAGAFEEALRTAFRTLPRSDRQLLRLATVEGCSIDQLACIYTIHRATAARRLQRVRRQVLRTVRRCLSAEHGMSEAEFYGIANDLKNLLNISLSGLDEPPVEG